jgi:hypothetical protein
MDISKFITVSAVIFGIIFTVIFFIRLAGFLLYRNDKLQQVSDSMNGIVRKFHLFPPFSAAALCWAWVIARWT